MVNPLPFMGHQGSPGHEGMSQMGLGMAIAASMVVLTMFQQFLFSHFGGYLERCLRKLVSSMDPYVQIRFTEESTDGGGPKNYEAYAAIETYLSSKCSAQAPRLKANSVRDINAPVLCVDDGEGVSDEFNGVTVWWHLGKEKDQGDIYRGSRRNRYYALTFRKKNREMVVGEYVRHVMEEGKAVAASHRQLKLYSNSSSEHGAYWNYIMDFDHPAKFETLAMEKEKKEEIIDDLIRYLLYGPPGTGKSTMIAAMANLLSYDVYDLELTAVLSNAALKRLLNRIPCNSILVIEDIDCSSKITNQREMNNQDEEKTVKILEKVTLSGLLNCIDGLFSANDGGRLMVFTTNNVEALDSALVRRGRMDRHIQMTYCGFEAFRILAKNYLGIEEHELFGRIEELLKESSVTPADVAETLIERRGKAEDCGGEFYLNKLIQVLEKNCETKKSINREMLEKKGKGEVENGECK
ncbi:hypothetical protein RHGRI_028328 [Rhododendron griersonianum]|uniref:AAA+ ATPase domain-containing protein n=1 Tax=Rhododendron griersonianum TaxID=479676 RepID=A0AAV6IG34_9ERIC|nr:hypothetical protein RHGRI_028328 [Rhododendron griersonianum]